MIGSRLALYAAGFGIVAALAGGLWWQIDAAATARADLKTALDFNASMAAAYAAKHDEAQRLLNLTGKYEANRAANKKLIADLRKKWRDSTDETCKNYLSPVVPDCVIDGLREHYGLEGDGTGTAENPI